MVGHGSADLQRIVRPGTGGAPEAAAAIEQFSGLTRPDPLRLGLDTNAEGWLLDAQGVASSFLYTLGAPCKGRLWETTAVPEIRGQAKALAQRLLA